MLCFQLQIHHLRYGFVSIDQGSKHLYIDWNGVARGVAVVASGRCHFGYETAFETRGLFSSHPNGFGNHSASHGTGTSFVLGTVCIFHRLVVHPIDVGHESSLGESTTASICRSQPSFESNRSRSSPCLNGSIPMYVLSHLSRRLFTTTTTITITTR